MKNEELPYFKMVAYLNAFVIHYNRKDANGMKSTLASLEKNSVQREMDRVRILQSRLKYLTFLGNEMGCVPLIEEMDGMVPNMSEADQVNFLICKFDVYTRFHRMEKCSEILEEMKAHRKFNYNQNYNFMKLLLLHYTEHAPIYLDDKEFAAWPALYHQLKIIQRFEEGDRGSALDHWSKLREMCPALYQGEFDYQGPQNLFSLCLGKYLKASVPKESPVEGDSMFEKLHKILIEAQAPIRKELLFELIWGRPVESKDDLRKLSQRIYRMRLKYRVDVKSRKGCYYLESAFKRPPPHAKRRQN